MTGSPWLRRCSSPAAAVLILLGFWIALVASLSQKSFTEDEAVHATAGYTRWRFNDYRINPENGNLPQRWIALPLLAGATKFPPTDSPDWRNGNAEAVSEQWFDRMGNDTAAMVFRGRAMAALLAVALGALVWWWSRQLFGPAGGLISLLLFVLDPTILANGALMTSDTASALFFLASLCGLWTVLHRLTPGRLLLSALAMGGLFVSKMSAILIVPIALALCLIRLGCGPPIEVKIGQRRWSLASARSRALAFFLVAVVHAAVVVAVIWGFHGFRYQALAPDGPAGSRLEEEWTTLLGPPGAPGQPATARVWEYVRAHRLLPEAYVYGEAHSWKFSRLRSAFLNGQVSFTGWRWFFPYTFLVKTPFATFGVIVLAAFALRRGRLYEIIPLLLLFGAYWAVAITTPLNIGHRHLLPTYPPLFVLCGAAGYWLTAAAAKEPKKSRRPRWLLFGALALLALETAFAFPNYLSYVNRLAGGEARGYRHLVDSSLDWGQDLPGLQHYLADHPQDQPAFLAYFGTASPDSYHLPVQYLHSVRGVDVAPAMRLLMVPADQARAQFADLRQRHPEYQMVGGVQQPNGRVAILLLKRPAALRLGPGTYFISATLLQPLMYDFNGPLGPWNKRYERTYQTLYARVKPLLSEDPSVREAALHQHQATEWATTLEAFDTYRFGRLTAYLRQREPADNVNGSILVYPLGPAEIAQAVDGPPPELGEDLPVLSGQVKASALSPRP